MLRENASSAAPMISAFSPQEPCDLNGLLL
jgi:hypothetical protein